MSEMSPRGTAVEGNILSGARDLTFKIGYGSRAYVERTASVYILGVLVFIAMF